MYENLDYTKVGSVGSVVGRRAGQLEPGISSVTKDFAGYKCVGVVPRTGNQVRLDLVRQIRDLTQSVEVTAEAPLLQAAWDRQPNLNADARSTTRWFDTRAFTATPQFVIENNSRNPVRGPRYRVVALMASKTSSIGHPNGPFGTAALGTIAMALDPRVFEVVLKLQF